jgi:phosphatidylglycerol:prolipoprotein diacylglycerol transferase
MVCLLRQIKQSVDFPFMSFNAMRECVLGKRSPPMIAAIPFPNFDPEVFSFEIGPVAFALRWYALAYIFGLIIGWRMIVALVRRHALWPNQTAPMTAQQVEDLLTWVILGVVLGGRLGFVIFYKPVYYMQNPEEIVMIWKGGMAFHGGLLGVVIAVALFAWRLRLPVLQVADALAVATPVGLLLGRIANFINGELWGRPTDVPWGVIFPSELAQNCDGILGVCARHPSQLYEAALEGLFLGLIVLVIALRGGLKRPGLLTGVFFAGYGLARVFVEQFRQADIQFVSPENPVGHAIQIGDWGLTMGQVLSWPMILFGFVVAVWALRRLRRT